MGTVEPLVASPRLLDFGRLRPASERTLDLTLENPARTMTNVRLRIDGDVKGAFSIATASAVTVQPASTEVVTLRFVAPLAAGQLTAQAVLSVEGAADQLVELRAEVASGADVCGDGVLGGAETCDPVASCVSACADDGDVCTREVLVGAAATCDVECTHPRITACSPRDGCCPAGCNSTNDSDCSACGNGQLDRGEKCDPAGTCPSSCTKPNACTSATLVGSAQACSAECRYAPITACVAGDNCCLPGCTPATDGDCGVCGDGVCQAAETCEGCVEDCGRAPPTATVTAVCTSTQLSQYQPAKSCADEAAVVAVYQPTDTPATNDVISVTVNRLTVRTLVLSSYEPVQWIVRPAPGNRIERIVLTGFHRQMVNLWGNVQLEDRTLPVAGAQYLGCAYAWPGDTSPGSCNSQALVRAVEQLSGHRVAVFAGCYEASAFTID